MLHRQAVAKVLHWKADRPLQHSRKRVGDTSWQSAVQPQVHENNVAQCSVRLCPAVTGDNLRHLVVFAQEASYLFKGALTFVVSYIWLGGGVQGRRRAQTYQNRCNI